MKNVIAMAGMLLLLSNLAMAGVQIKSVPTAAKWTTAAAFTIPTGSATDVPLQNRVFDTLELYDTGATAFVAREAGIYQVNGQITLEPMTNTGELSVEIFINGIVSSSAAVNSYQKTSSSLYSPSVSFTSMMLLRAGDAVYFRTTHNFGASKDLNGDPLRNWGEFKKLD